MTGPGAAAAASRAPLLALALLWLCSLCRGSTFSDSARPRFEDKFKSVCSKYPFVAQYLDMQRRPRENYVIYVFHEAGGGGGGGLGDRLGGMITALAFALRTNRQFLIQGDKPFTDAFAPYQGEAQTDPSPLLPADSRNRTWAEWGWAGWRAEFASNMSYNRHCVNPKPRGTACALDRDSPAVKVIKFRGNRAYLCRWAIKPSLQLQDGLRLSLGVDRSTDLYEAAGCLLRLAMWPTPRLWAVLDASVARHLGAAAAAGSAVATTATAAATVATVATVATPATAATAATAAGVGPVTFQLSFHFRCGDSSFSAGAATPINRQCVWDSALPWTGTNFADDASLDSPVDLGVCGRLILASLGAGAAGAAGTAGAAASTGTAATSTSTNPGTGAGASAGAGAGVLAYIASDYPPSAAQVGASLGWARTVTPLEACHVDLRRSNKGSGSGSGSSSGSSSGSGSGAASVEDCTLSTTSQWLMLALSDALVIQSLLPSPDSSSPYKPKSLETAALPPSALGAPPDELGPISAFSRYAAIYALGADVMRYGRNCSTVDKRRLSWQTMGNWVCDPRMFH